MTNVSVIIPAYNQGYYLNHAIRSVLNQTYTDFELIVVDDGSTDDTAEIVRSFNDQRICYVYQENRGLSAARNTGIRCANGQYLSFLDSDDLFLPDKLTLLVTLMHDQPWLGLVAGQAIPINDQGLRIGKIYDTPLPAEASLLLLGNPLHVGSVLLHKSWQDKVGYFDESLRSYEDWDMWLRLLRIGCRAGWVEKPVSYYRFHSAQMTRIGSQMTSATFAVLDKVYNEPDLPENWLSLHDRAYSKAHLRAAAQAYISGELPIAKSNLLEAVRLDPELTADEAELLAKHLASLADSPKNPNPLKYLELVYSNLPDGLSILRHRRRGDLGRFAIQQAFSAYQDNDLTRSRHAMLRAIRYNPAFIKNKGVLSILMRSFLSSQHGYSKE